MKDSIVNNTVAGAHNSANSVSPEDAIPLFYEQWWFWLGLVAILLVFKFVLFKKK